MEKFLYIRKYSIPLQNKKVLYGKFWKNIRIQRPVCRSDAWLTTVRHSLNNNFLKKTNTMKQRSLSERFSKKINFFIFLCFATMVLTAVAQERNEISELPYTTDFSTSEGWQLNNGSYSNHWTIAPMGSGNALFVTNDGTSPGYTYSYRCAISAEKLLKIGNASNVIVSFDLKCGGKNMHDYLKMFLAPSTYTYEAGAAPSWSFKDNSLYAADFYDHFDMTNTYPNYHYIINLTRNQTIHVEVLMSNPIENPDTNSVAKLVFGWYNDIGSTYDHGIQPGAIISNLRVRVEMCPPPVGFSVSNVQEHSADLTWDVPENGIMDHIVQYVQDGRNWDNAYVTTMNVQDTFTTLTGIQSITEYWARVAHNCGSDTSVWAKQSFTTSCEYIDTLPFSCDFSVYPSTNWPIPYCWTKGPTDVCDPHINSGALFFSNPNTIAMPHLNSQLINITMTEVSFYAKGGNNSKLIVGVMTDANDPSTFVAVDTLMMTSSYAYYAVPFSNYTGNGDRIAFQNVSGTVYVDDLFIDYHPSCSRPHEQLSYAPTHNSVNLRWTSTASSYNLYYRIKGESTFTVISNITLNNNQEYTLSGLMRSTIYQWYVSAVCNDSTEVASHELSEFATLCNAITLLPVTWDFESYNNETLLPVCWSTLNGSNRIQTDNAHSGTHSLLLWDNNSTSIVVLPEVETSLYPLNSLQLRFFAMNMGSYSNWHVRVIGGSLWNPTDAASFIPTDTIDVIGSAGGSFQEYILRLFYPYYGAGRYPALKFVRISQVYWLLVDDLTLEVADSLLLPERPTVTTNEATGIEQTAATLNASVWNPNNMDISSNGFEWKEVSSDSSAQSIKENTSELFSVHLTELSPNTEYSYRAFVTIGDLVIYGNELTFNTLINGNDTVHIEDFPLNLISLYPNPAKDVINVQGANNNVQLNITAVEVYDVCGKLINNVNVNNNSINIDVSNLADGFYYVRVNTEQGVITKTFVKRM